MPLPGKQSSDVSEWDAEMDRYEFSQDDLETVETAVLPDELALYEVMADNDPKFTEHWCDWEEFIYENWLFLALQQSCYEGILLPTDQRAIRLQSGPEATSSKLRWFFQLYPPHVKAHLALRWYHLMRLDRARRTGSPEWYRHVIDQRPGAQNVEATSANYLPNSRSRTRTQPSRRLVAQLIGQDGQPSRIPCQPSFERLAQRRWEL